MRWKAPSERTQTILLMPILAPVTVVALVAFGPPIAVMLGLDWLRNRYGPPRKTTWYPWFAWRPVRCDGFFYDQPDRWVWFETIQRHPRGKYRMPEWKSFYQGEEI